MEIRLLVNGNLVHTVTMADLQLITSKRDIYFATTAPVFIPKDFWIKGVENDTAVPEHNDDCSNERILEIKHKIEKQIPAVQSEETVTIHINTEDNLLPVPMLTDLPPSMQRARSLQKQPERQNSDEQKRQISKSNSCGEAYGKVTSSSDNFISTALARQLREPTVPPNSPKITSTIDTTDSPNKKLYTKSAIYNLTHSVITEAGAADGTEKIKPLRIFRIPLANLTGAHSHYHARNSIPTSMSRVTVPSTSGVVDQAVATLNETVPTEVLRLSNETIEETVEILKTEPTSTGNTGVRRKCVEFREQINGCTGFTFTAL